MGQSCPIAASGSNTVINKNAKRISFAAFLIFLRSCEYWFPWISIVIAFVILIFQHFLFGDSHRGRGHGSRCDPGAGHADLMRAAWIIVRDVELSPTRSTG